jgi:hypothetical protein
VNAEPDLLFIRSSSLAFVMNFITLQHIPPPAVISYLGDLLRFLRRAPLTALRRGASQ